MIAGQVQNSFVYLHFFVLFSRCSRGASFVYARVPCVNGILQSQTIDEVTMNEINLFVLFLKLRSRHYDRVYIEVSVTTAARKSV